MIIISYLQQDSFSSHMTKFSKIKQYMKREQLFTFREHLADDILFISTCTVVPLVTKTVTKKKERIIADI